MSDTPRGPLDLEALREQVGTLQALIVEQGKALAEMYQALAAVAAALAGVTQIVQGLVLPTSNGGAHGGAG
jgi:hypothetical protein